MGREIGKCPWCDESAGLTGDVYRHVQCQDPQCAACGPVCGTDAEAVNKWNGLGYVIRTAKLLKAGYQNAFEALMDALTEFETQEKPSRPIGECSVCGRTAWEWHTSLGRWTCTSCINVGRIPVKEGSQHD